MEYIEAVDTMAQYTMNEVIDDIKEADGYERKGEVMTGTCLMYSVKVHAYTQVPSNMLLLHYNNWTLFLLGNNVRCTI